MEEAIAAEVRTSKASADSPSEDMLRAAAEITAEDIAANIEFTRRFYSPLMKAMLNARAEAGNLIDRVPENRGKRG